MTARPRPIASMLLALAGPIVWLAHFFALYLAEAFLCTVPGPGSTMTLRTMAVVLTVLATLVLSVAASGYASGFSGFDGSNPSGAHLALDQTAGAAVDPRCPLDFRSRSPAAGLHAGAG